MWIFTNIGFFSVIEHRKDKELLLIRSRVKGDLEELKKQFLPNLGDVLATPTMADYPYRAVAWRSDFAEAMKLAVNAVDYTNFKSGISATQGHARHNLYMKVWSVMKDAEKTLERMEREDKEVGKQYSMTSWTALEREHGITDDRDDGRYGGNGSKFSRKTYQATLDLEGSRKARNKRLGLSGISPNFRKGKIEEDEEDAREARRHVETLIVNQLKGGEHDFDKEFEDEPDVPPSNWLSSTEKFMEELTLEDKMDPTIQDFEDAEE